MIERVLQLPVSRDEVWEAITDPSAVAGWFGGTVEWELRPGAAARFDGADGEREGVVTEVELGRHLRFEWWPAGDEAGTSEVSYHLDGDDEDLTVLRVTERRVDAPLSPAGTPASARTAYEGAGPAAHLGTGGLSAGAPRSSAEGDASWAWADTLALGVWACCSAGASAPATRR